MSSKRSYSINKIGIPRYLWRDVYFSILRSRWWVFFLFIFLVYLLTNCLFAGLYHLAPHSLVGDAQDSFTSSFLFSVQTISTVGYGYLRPASGLGHALMVVECIIGVIFVAMITGMTFAKVSKPQAKVLFSNNILKTSFEGKNVLMFRVGNLRANRVLGAVVDLTIVVPKDVGNGNTMRRLYTLKPIRSHTPIFELSWTIIIPLEDNSELEAALADPGIEFDIVANLRGHDTDFSSILSASHIYDRNDLELGSGFVNILKEHTRVRRELDYTKFHEILP
jgi:inward rectifier potassium channel